ncbi:hypothetical protein SAMN05421823_105184 [Catalinimonas alkaloidigena]|uniref:Uncharacterized protein n=1 Tax=Catalinimonas alkaloidigena TaxID=1075417 RepID=A0A1G9J2Q0_9BACT|nr:hypothetical protein SAMN05421823_105184 [Catalinimonas alkaloidigena]
MSNQQSRPCKSVKAHFSVLPSQTSHYRDQLGLSFHKGNSAQNETLKAALKDVYVAYVPDNPRVKALSRQLTPACNAKG